MKQRNLFGVKPTKSPDTKVVNKGRLTTPKVVNKYDTAQFDKYDLVYSKIQQRRLQMLVHSCIYYELNSSLITDKQFDTWARELVKLQNENPEISKQVPWYEEFKDWDGTTGYHLPLREPWVVGKSMRLLSMKGERNG